MRLWKVACATRGQQLLDLGLTSVMGGVSRNLWQCQSWCGNDSKSRKMYHVRACGSPLPSRRKPIHIKAL